MIPVEVMKKIRRIEIRTSHVVDDMLGGQYHSAFKGRGSFRRARLKVAEVGVRETAALAINRAASKLRGRA